MKEHAAAPKRRTQSQGYDNNTFLGTIIRRKRADGTFHEGEVIRIQPHDGIYVIKYCNGDLDELTQYELEQC